MLGMALNDTKLILNDFKGVTHAHLGPMWYHLEPSDVPYSPHQFLGWDFFPPFLTATGSRFELESKHHASIVCVLYSSVHPRKSYHTWLHHATGLSMSNYPKKKIWFYLILSKFYPHLLQVLFFFCPCFILVSFLFYTNFIQIK